MIFTGSSENGRDVLSGLAHRNTPAVMELSGEDAVLVLADADLSLVVRALRFGTRWNGGQTCIAPRRHRCHRAPRERSYRAHVASRRSGIAD